MIQSKSEHKDQKRSIEQLKREREQARKRSLDAGLPPEYLPMALAGYDQMIEDLQFQLEEYERLMLGKVRPSASLEELRQQLPRFRVARGWSQKQLAECMGVSEAQVSRDERHEYAGITLKRAQAILDCLGVGLEVAYTLPCAASGFNAGAHATRYAGSGGLALLEDCGAMSVAASCGAMSMAA